MMLVDENIQLYKVDKTNFEIRQKSYFLTWKKKKGKCIFTFTECISMLWTCCITQLYRLWEKTMSSEWARHIKSHTYWRKWEGAPSCWSLSSSSWGKDNFTAYPRMKCLTLFFMKKNGMSTFHWVMTRKTLMTFCNFWHKMICA